MNAGTVVTYQHDTRIHPNVEVTLFDDAASTDALLGRRP